jgi:RNA polymerase-binding transcription factor DksA
MQVKTASPAHGYRGRMAIHYHYLTLEQRSTLERIIRSRVAAPAQLASALARLHQPDYGVCIECGKDIGYDRLEADPDALHCKACACLPIQRERT